MTKLLQHLDEMRARLGEVASDEQALIKALGDALNRLDQQLLRDVRTIATEHEVRREEILGELQGLACGIGMFRGPLPPPASEELPAYRPSPARQQKIAPGDWRQAASNIEDEFDFKLNGRAPSH